MKRAIMALCVMHSATAVAANIDLGEFALNAGVAVGKAVACKLDGARIIKATKTSFATINVVSKTEKARADATRIFDQAMPLGEAYIKQNGTTHCKKIDKTLDVIINLGR